MPLVPGPAGELEEVMAGVHRPNHGPIIGEYCGAVTNHSSPVHGAEQRGGGLHALGGQAHAGAAAAAVPGYWCLSGGGQWESHGE